MSVSASSAAFSDLAFTVKALPNRSESSHASFAASSVACPATSGVASQAFFWAADSNVIVNAPNTPAFISTSSRSSRIDSIKPSRPAMPSCSEGRPRHHLSS
ncbi:MAG: hypothetical protein KC668_22185 [Myxococcales bacterium]|nr:hypothetical protein [Myxococcales bacterium]